MSSPKDSEVGPEAERIRGQRIHLCCKGCRGAWTCVPGTVGATSSPTIDQNECRTQPPFMDGKSAESVEKVLGNLRVAKSICVDPLEGTCWGEQLAVVIPSAIGIGIECKE